LSYVKVSPLYVSMLQNLEVWTSGNVGHDLKDYSKKVSEKGETPCFRLLSDLITDGGHASICVGNISTLGNHFNRHKKENYSQNVTHIEE